MRGLFGEIIDWMGDGIPKLILLGTVFVCLVLYFTERYSDAAATVYMTTIIIGVAAAALVFVVGRVLRYFLAGTK
jgi:hypothetical protein